jgi:hypothetical protein
MRRVQARWACRNAAEFVRFAIEFSDMVKEEAVPEGEAPVEEEHEGGDTVGVTKVGIRWAFGQIHMSARPLRQSNCVSHNRIVSARKESWCDRTSPSCSYGLACQCLSCVIVSHKLRTSPFASLPMLRRPAALA